MKKYLLAAILLLTFLVALSFAADVVQTGNDYTDYNGGKMKVATFSITSDGGGDVAIWTFLKDRELNGYYLVSAEIYSTTDDAFTVILTSSLGSTLLTKTTTSATSGEFATPSAVWPIYSATKIDVTGLAATNTATVVVAFEKK